MTTENYRRLYFLVTCRKTAWTIRSFASSLSGYFVATEKSELVELSHLLQLIRNLPCHFVQDVRREISDLSKRRLQFAYRNSIGITLWLWNMQNVSHCWLITCKSHILHHCRSPIMPDTVYCPKDSSIWNTRWGVESEM